MIISLDKDYQSALLFQPIRRANSTLLGVEVVANFSSREGDIRIPTELVIPRISEEEQLILFYEKLAVLEKHRALFVKNGLCAWININGVHVTTILHNEKLAARLAQLPFVEFTISENYPDLNAGKENTPLLTFSRRYPLVLANFGAGTATTRSIYDRLFKRIVLDKFFIHKHIGEESFEPFMKAIVDQVAPFCRTMIIAGIDNERARKKAVSLRFQAMQGNLWPMMEPEALQFLLPHHQ
ncbi:EAL domain-containing protein [Atlantibacter sp.]|uniref:EAL domain-containing protein n=1 Tax=Atlantibacter sp. TaxID=1903473 RepID=UPI002897F585|nr:EAL domain-containing protein [Atlantibacter sp.]